MKPKIEKSWEQALAAEWDAPYFQELSRYVEERRQVAEVYPPAGSTYAAFELCPLPQVKVVILGQDPYHGPGQAHGLSFSVPDGVRQPPSLRNIMREVNADTGSPIPVSGNLSRWARQGVLLLNATLTVEAHRAGSHQRKGWEEFTDRVISTVSEQCEGVVFMLWGAYATAKRRLIDENRHLVLTGVHPSPLSAHRGFFGNRHFSTANSYLMAHGKSPIEW